MISTVAVIPARGGSKGIPRKNLIDFCGFPLLAWTIACARRSRAIDVVCVSTDDPEISDVAARYGAVAIQRPADISGDRATSESALQHAVTAIPNLDPRGRMVFLQATSPLRQAVELDEALGQFDRDGLDSLFSAASAEDFCLWKQSGPSLESLNYDFRNRRRRQDMPADEQVWIETGSFYVTRLETLAAGNRLGGKIGMFPVASWKAFEIDSLESLELCAALMRRHGLDRLTPDDQRV